MSHGLSYTPEYRAWQQMIRRCHNPEHPAYANYGGRGIFVCDEWREDVTTFVADMGERPSPAHELDRIDNDKGRFSLVFMAAPGDESAPVELTHNWDGDDALPSDSRHFGHLAYEVEDIYAARDEMRAKGATVLGTGEPRIGAHGTPVIFVHPKDMGGVLVELMAEPSH